MSEEARPKRRYDATGRRVRAEATRDRVVEAASRVFLARGYAGATIPAIAAEAGVALQTVYRAAPGKAGLLAAAVNAAVAGGVERSQRPVETRPAIRAIIDEPDPRRQLALYARTQPGIWARVGPLLGVLQAAAASEPDLRRLQQEQDAQRHGGRTRFTRLLHERGVLPPALTPPACRGGSPAPPAPAPGGRRSHRDAGGARDPPEPGDHAPRGPRALRRRA